MSERRLSSKQVAALVVVAALAGYIMGRLSTNLRINLGGGGGEAGAFDSSEFLRADPGPIEQDSDIVPIDDAPFLGPGAAKVTIVEFSDFQCPFCARANPVIHDLLEQYGDDLRLVYRQLPLPMHPDAMPAARAAAAANAQGKFWPYHDLLFANQRALDAASLAHYADEVGLDMDAFRAAVASDDTANSVAADMAVANRLGINGTPSFMVNGDPVIGALPIEEFRHVIDGEMAAADALIQSGVPLTEVYRRRVAANQTQQQAPPQGGSTGTGSAHGAAEAPDPADGGQLAAADDPPPIPDGHADLTVYVDYSDPRSIDLARTVERLRANYGQHLAVHYEPLADPADPRAAAIAAAVREAQAEGRFADLHEFLLSTPAPITVDALRQWAGSNGLDAAALTAALDEASARQAAEAARVVARQQGIILAPAVQVGGVHLAGSVPYEDLRVAVNAAMESQ